MAIRRLEVEGPGDPLPVKLYTLDDQATLEVLFDVDGVLLFSWRFRAHLVEEYGITPEQTKPFFESPFKRCSVGEGDLFNLLRPFLRQWKWPGSIESFVATWFALDGVPDQRVLQFIANLRSTGVRCHIVSTQERHRAAHLMRELDLVNQFDSVHFSCDVGAAKPDPEYYYRVEQRLNRSAEHLLFIDDARENIDSAVRLGWQAIHYTGVDSLAQISERMKLVV